MCPRFEDPFALWDLEFLAGSHLRVAASFMQLQLLHSEIKMATAAEATKVQQQVHLQVHLIVLSQSDMWSVA